MFRLFQLFRTWQRVHPRDCCAQLRRRPLCLQLLHCSVLSPTPQQKLPQTDAIRLVRAHIVWRQKLVSCSDASDVAVVAHLVAPMEALLPFHARFHQTRSDLQPHRWPRVAPVRKPPANARARAPSVLVRDGLLRCAWPNQSTLARDRHGLRQSSRDPVVWPAPTLVRLRLIHPIGDGRLQHLTLHEAESPHDLPHAPHARLIQQRGHALLGRLLGPHSEFVLPQHPTTQLLQLHRLRQHQLALGLAWLSVRSPKIARVPKVEPSPPRPAARSPAPLLRDIRDDSA